MSWEQALLDLFDDLEAQAAGLHQAARDEDVADLAGAEYAEVALVERLHGALGAEVRLEVSGGTAVRGPLQRVGRGCVAVRSTDVPRVLHLVNLDHVSSVATTSTRAETSATLPLTARLGMAAAVRHLAEEVDEVRLRLADGRLVTGTLARVGADFLELTPAADDGRGELLVPLAAIATLAPA